MPGYPDLKRSILAPNSKREAKRKSVLQAWADLQTTNFKKFISSKNLGKKGA